MQIDKFTIANRKQFFNLTGKHIAIVDFEFTCHEEKNGKRQEVCKREILAIGLLIDRIERLAGGIFDLKLVAGQQDLLKPLESEVTEYCA